MFERKQNRVSESSTSLVKSVLLIALLAILSVAVSAQKLPEGDARNEAFRNHFQKVVSLNADIKDFEGMDIGRSYNLPDAKTDRLEVGDDHGIWGHEFKKFYGISYEAWLQGQALPTPTPTATPTPNPTATRLPSTFQSSDSGVSFWDSIPWFWLFWILVAVLILGLLYLAYWLFKRSPTGWRPVVTGGAVSDDHADTIMRNRGRSRGMELIPGSIERVRLFGPWLTRHHGVPVSIPHNYNAERAYRARFRKQNGTEVVGYMLQGCGNDVAAGHWYTGLPGSRVEEGWDTPPTQPITPTQTNPASMVSEATPVVEEKIEEGVIKFELRKAGEDQPAMARLEGIDESGDNTIEIKSGKITIRYTPRS